MQYLKKSIFLIKRNIYEEKECLKTYNDNLNYKRVTLSKCTNSPSERKIFQFLP